MADIVMPRLSDSMEEGTILRWLKRNGDEVRRGEELVEIETDVAAMVDLATEEAKAGAVPGEEYLLKDVWADGGYQWRN